MVTEHLALSSKGGIALAENKSQNAMEDDSNETTAFHIPVMLGFDASRTGDVPTCLVKSVRGRMSLPSLHPTLHDEGTETLAGYERVYDI